MGPDPEVSIAARQTRILVTHERRTMPTHFVNFILHENSPGVLVIRKQLSERAAIEELMLIWAASDNKE